MVKHVGEVTTGNTLPHIYTLLKVKGETSTFHRLAGKSAVHLCCSGNSYGFM